MHRKELNIIMILSKTTKEREGEYERNSRWRMAGNDYTIYRRQ